ncbi:MAG TPA: hypothetical protein IAB17_06630 [Candidatus Alectryocaccobium stercorigallinarum]|nr:hypothetical protein [Candidatus Alectryocaccobium stercorigallinarum]
MQDERIVALYWERNESAISETDKKYGRRLFNIAYNILSEREDSLESVSKPISNRRDMYYDRSGIYTRRAAVLRRRPAA